jgi:hypothetical protein
MCVFVVKLFVAFLDSDFGFIVVGRVHLAVAVSPFLAAVASRRCLFCSFLPLVFDIVMRQHSVGVSSLLSALLVKQTERFCQ